MNIRYDGWKDEEDGILANTILEYVAEGKTQLKAFEDVGIRLSRTAAACGFRWNSELRYDYKEQLMKAKAQRQKNKNARSTIVETNPIEARSHIMLALKEAEHALQKAVRNIQDIMRNLEIEFKNNEQLITDLRRERTEAPLSSEDMSALLKLLSKARNMGLYDKIG